MLSGDNSGVPGRTGPDPDHRQEYLGRRYPGSGPVNQARIHGSVLAPAHRAPVGAVGVMAAPRMPVVDVSRIAPAMKADEVGGATIEGLGFENG